MNLIEQISEKLKSHHWKLVTAESCTGGGLAYHLTQIPGSSAWYERGFVTYSNDAKEQLLQVKNQTLVQHGAVSAETASEMAVGALQNSQAQLSISITGIAGPDGGTKEKPVGTVWFGWAGKYIKTETEMQLFEGDRTSIREQAIQFALAKIITLL